ncbi:MAG TPA: plastocyanin/azurin family copper-binding protein [Acidimicrobiia bacterium]|nr:plastocyanin/azurin family copper-binding protein [Acidimicrobiia bacterium]
MRARLFIIGAALMVAPLLITACGSSSKGSSSTPTTTGGGVTVPTTASGATTVHVTVSDTKGLDGPMTLTADTSSVPAGDVTFTVKNTGTIDHEVVVLKTDTAFDKLKITTFDGEPNRVDEGSSVGETGDPALKPGESRSFTLKGMKAGAYVLVCNIAKHYGLGMRAAFTVS